MHLCKPLSLLQNTTSKEKQQGNVLPTTLL